MRVLVLVCALCILCFTVEWLPIVWVYCSLFRKDDFNIHYLYFNHPITLSLFAALFLTFTYHIISSNFKFIFASLSLYFYVQTMYAHSYKFPIRNLWQISVLWLLWCWIHKPDIHTQTRTHSKLIEFHTVFKFVYAVHMIYKYYQSEAGLMPRHVQLAVQGT